MARAFPNTFEQDSPMTPQSASSISYQTNVNRQKTKKWTQAKAVNYDGDDWGDEDDYGVAPPPVSKPTGFRQQGQGLQSSAKPESPAFDNAKKYGDLPPLPGANDPRGRRNSFDADDEKRNFSSAGIRQPSPAAITPTSSAGPATRFSQITGVPSTRSTSGPALSIQTQQPQANTGLRKAVHAASPIPESPHPEILLPGRVNTGESSIISPASVAPSSASDFHARRDYSPSAVPPPLAAKASPAPQSATETPSARFPARKSSLSQPMGPPLAEITRQPTAESTPKPWVAGRPASPGASAKSPTTPTGKALPFIRPADIYRRAEEERRESLESGRPSMDSITGAKSSDRSDSLAMPQLRERLSSDSLGGSARRRPSFEGDDGSESGRRLVPMLEPVRERKSEYGFEGFNVDNQAPIHSTVSANENDDDKEEARRLSISPKLPDLNRISGFGIDMFTHSKPDVSDSTVSKNANSTPTATTTALSPTEEDLTLRTRPSFGFRSVVNQAFDRSDDSSVPPTPASITGSGVKRTDSESTGTTGISPIMSRVPSGAAPDSRHRDLPSQSILEVVNEPDSPETSHGQGTDEVRGREIPGFKPGYRRDISTPRSDNSPARTPDLSKTKIITSGQHAVVSETSPEVDPIESEPLQAPRPIAEREGSFRPSLPGGWTSYATTAQSENPSQAPSVRTQTPAREVSPMRDDLDITPTTVKHTLPRSELGATATGAVIVGNASLRQRDSPAAPVLAKSEAFSSHGDLPTPDPLMAPSGNLYSTTTLDPRLLPKLDQPPVEAQLRANAISRDVSEESSPAPSLPPKDNIDLDSHDQHSSSSAPLQSQTTVEAETTEPSLPRIQSSMPLAPSTDIYSNDEENEKLQEEIVKSLTPRPSSGIARDQHILSDEFDEANHPKQGHESTYLPSEYDNYWASTSDDNHGHVDPLPIPVEDPSKKDVARPQSIVKQEQAEVDSPIVAPLSPRRAEQPSLEPPRPPIQSRFSWEQSNESVNRNISNDEVSEVSAASSPVHAPQTVDEPPVIPTAPLADSQLAASDPVRSIERQQEEAPTSHQSSEHYDNTNAMLAAAGAATLAAATVPVYTPPAQEPKSRRLSLAEEKDPRVSSHPVSPTPPEDEHPARATQSYFSPSPNQHSPIHAPSTVSPIASPILHHQQFIPPVSPILTWKEIISKSTPQERIQAFDFTRKRVATMDSGLNEWIATIQTRHPEHADVGPSFGGSRTSFPSGTGRSKFGKATGSAAPPLQQPYYQQYLNASSPTNPSTPIGPRPGPSPSAGIPSGSQQGFSTNSGKITTHQVQAKGKELLHSAGIFGGKAGKAGKGLLAKGKSKFRSGGDKTSASPPKPKNEQPKQERRSSWGLPLNLSRSSGRPDAARQSREFSPQPERPRAATASSNRSLTAPQLPAVSTGPSLGIMSGALPSMDDSPERARPQSSTVRQVHPSESAEEASEARDSLGVPAPIGKHQPTWDPYNATPIAEEEGFQYDERPRQRQLSSDVSNRHGSLAVPAGVKPGSERSNSDDTHFYSAQEDDSDIPRDWVMVPPNPESRDAPPNLTSAAVQKPGPILEPESRRSVDQAPVTSILNRPRGSSYEMPSPPPSSKGPAPKPAEPISVVATPPQITPSPPKPAQSEPEKQTGASSFLPPIRRTSTFGLGFGSRHAKPRFALEDEDEGGIPEGAAKPSVENAELPSKSAEQDELPPPEQPSLPQKPTAHIVNDAPIPPVVSARITNPPSHQSPGPQARASQEVPSRQPALQQPAPQPRVSTEQSTLIPRPLSFIQTSGAGEILHTPARAAEQRQVANEMLSRQPPRYTEPEQIREQPPIQQAPREEARVMNLPQDLSSQGGNAPRLPLVQSGSSDYSQRSGQNQHTVLPPQLNQSGPSPSRSPEQLQRNEQNQRPNGPPAHQHPYLPPLITPRAADVLQRPEFRESQVEWRPNRPKAADAAPIMSPSFLKEVDVPAPKHSNSWEPQRPRGNSGSSASYTQRPDGQHNERAAWAGSSAPYGPYPQPPSSAQRYPELFRPGQTKPDEPRDSADLPAHYYQAPITREAAFLPRAQTNEYQIPGVGPPSDDPRSTHSRRNSGFFKEIGGRLSRASSRDRGNSISRDEGSPSPARQFGSRGGEYAESSVASEGEQERRKRRASFFGNLSRNSTSGLGPPQSRESVIAHHSASRTDLLSAQPSPTHQERKRSIFGGGSKEPKEKPNKLVRASTGSVDPAAKKHRFSGLSSMFGKNSQSRESVQERPQATRELSHNERQPIESSPQLDAQRPVMNNTQSPNRPRGGSQTRQVLQKLTSSPSPRGSPRADKTRRTSSSGLLGGLMGRKSNQQDKGSDDSRSQGSSSQARSAAPRPLPPAQTYSDLQDEPPMGPPPQQRREMPFQDPSLRVEDRGRQISREPQYDNVPIPGGYQLVRGQGAMQVATDYDPRGLNRVPQQIDPRYNQPMHNSLHHPNGVPMQAPHQQYVHDGRYGPRPNQSQSPPVSDTRQLLQPKPHLGALEIHENYTARGAPRRISREDLLARSPPKSLEGQQRPYQISLPGDDEERPVPISKDPTSPVSITSAPRQVRPQHDAIQRLQQPILRHPESPAGYPLPEDTVFSPVNPAANDMQAPPPPQWPNRVESHRSNASHERQVSLSTLDGDLDRSNTRRTAVSAVSGLSGSGPQSGGLNVPNRQISDATETDRDRRHLASPSPSPPSPLPDTPDANVSPNLGHQQEDIRTTELTAKRSGEDLYNASPRLPKHVSNSNGNRNSHMNKGYLQPNGKENLERSFSAAAAQHSETREGDGVVRATSASQAQAQVQEEKIPHDNTTGRAELPVGGRDDDGPPEMSAVSYPGMEWNPYAAGAWDDGYD